MDPRYPHGRVFLVYNTSDVSEDELIKEHGSAHVWYRVSTDDGAKWAAPVEITSSVKLPSWGLYGTGPGHGLQLTDGPHKGRIFIPAFHSEEKPGGDHVEGLAHGFFSDDHGQTWTLGATVTWSGSSESTAAQAADGSLVMNSRDDTGKSHARIVSISRSDGERWDTTFVAHDLPDPVSQGSMVSYAGPGQKPVLLFSNLLNTDSNDGSAIGNRHGLALSESTDDGRRWRRHTVIYKGSSAYSDLVVMQGGKLGIIWERADDGIVFTTRPIDHLF
jgi:sialidase-1